MVKPVYRKKELCKPRTNKIIAKHMQYSFYNQCMSFALQQENRLCIIYSINNKKMERKDDKNKNNEY